MSQQAFGAFEDASVQDAAFLSAAAWSENLGGVSLATYLNNNGWKLASVPDFKADSAGYYSTSSVQAFAATKGDTLAVSIRGIENQSDWPGAIQAVLDGGAAPYRDVLPFVNGAINSVQNDPTIKKILITGASRGGQTAELFAVAPTSMALPPSIDISSQIADTSAQLPLDFPPRMDLGRFKTSTSVISFGSPGIPSSTAGTNSSPLPVLNLYNTADPIYNHTGPLFAILNTIGFTHVGIQKPLYTPKVMEDAFFWHYPTTYKAETTALTSSTLFNSANDKTIFVFDANTSPSGATMDINDAALGIPKGLHFLVGLEGTDGLIGGPGDSILAYSGDHFITGLVGAESNSYEIITGNDEISNYHYPQDLLTLHSNVPIDGDFMKDPYGRTVLTYTQADQQKGTVTLDGVDLGSVASQIPWLHWQGTVG